MAKAVYRRRHNWHGFKRTWDRSGLWPQLTWLFWSWDYLPGENKAPPGDNDVAGRLSGLVDDMRRRKAGDQ